MSRQEYVREWREQNKERIKQYSINQYYKDIDKSRKYHREWRRKHRDACNKRNAEYYQKNRDKKLQYNQEYRLRPEVIERRIEYYKTNGDVLRQRQNERRSTPELRIKIRQKERERFERDKEKILQRRHEFKIQAYELLGGKCNNCSMSDSRYLCVDHKNNNGTEHRKIIRTSHQMYRWIIKNYPNFGQFPVQLLCFYCNGRKSRKI